MSPHFKVDVGSYSFIDDTINRITVTRPENNIGFAVLSIDDYKSKRFLDVFDAFIPVDISLYYGSDTPTKVFSGTVSTVAPNLSVVGEVLEAGIWGKEWPLIKTHCNTSYGVESANPTKEEPDEIIVDLINNYVAKSFGGATTGHNLGLSCENINDPIVTFLESQYKTCFDVLNTVCDLRNSWTAQQTPTQKSIHWIVNPDGNLCVKTIGASLGSWTAYWKGSQVASTIEVTKDMILYDFKKNVEEYANKVILCSQFRKPGQDIWNEDNGPTWGVVNCTASYVTDQFIVGSHSLKVEPTASPAMGLAYYPSTRNAAWDLTRIGSPKTIPTFNFYVRANNINAFGYPIYLFTDSTAIGGASDAYFWTQLDEYMTPRADKWVHISLPVGPHWALDPSLQKDDGSDEWEWNITGSPSWSNINGIALLLTGSNTYDKWFDDMHFSGKIIREAYDPVAITAKKEYQRVFVNNTAIDDSMKLTAPDVYDDSGTAARLTHVELLRRKQTPIVGVIQIPLAVDILPGQLIHVHAAKQSDSGTCAVCGASGTFRIAKDFRVKELTHEVNVQGGATTRLNLTDDLYNSHAFAAPSSYDLLMEYAGALGHAEAKNLKASGIDVLIPRLTKSY